MLATSHHPKLVELANAAHAYCTYMWEFPLDGMTLVLYGGNGCGKTKTAKGISSWVHNVGCHKSIPIMDGHKPSLSSYFAHWPSFLDDIKDGAWKLVDQLIAAPVLIIDEAGGEHDPSQVGVDKLCRILSAREKSWTVITTNISPESWAEVFDLRVDSRLKRNSWIVNLDGVPDYHSIPRVKLPPPQKFKGATQIHQNHNTDGYIPIEFPCCFCGRPIKTKVDPGAGQDWIDRLAAMTGCNSCADGRLARLAMKF